MLLLFSNHIFNFLICCLFRKILTIINWEFSYHVISYDYSIIIVVALPRWNSHPVVLPQPESLLWSLDARGHLLKLSTHSSQWQRVECPRSKVRHFSRAAASSWSVWAIASDQQCYLMVLSSDLKIRVQEALYENEVSALGSGTSCNLRTFDEVSHYKQVMNGFIN